MIDVYSIIFLHSVFHLIAAIVSLGFIISYIIEPMEIMFIRLPILIFSSSFAFAAGSALFIGIANPDFKFIPDFWNFLIVLILVIVEIYLLIIIFQKFKKRRKNE